MKKMSILTLHVTKRATDEYSGSFHFEMKLMK
jgi:hypothetical protein